jgi:hypothetical protein
MFMVLALTGISQAAEPAKILYITPGSAAAIQSANGARITNLDGKTYIL